MPNDQESDNFPIGLVVGGGVGAQLADVFRTAVLAFAAVSGRSVAINVCDHQPKSFTEMKHWTADRFEQSVLRDVEALDAFYRSTARAGVDIPVIHRTAVNAEALYQLRRRLDAVKLVRLEIDGVRLLLARDQTQGFYANSSWSIEQDRVQFAGTFDQQNIRRVVEAAREESHGWLRTGYQTWLVFKHHLFANVFVRWAREIGGIDEVQQPGAAYMLLLRHLANQGGDLMVVGSNEIIDLLHEVLLARSGAETRETGIARSVFLHHELRKLTEYQTVHGSADDLTGTDRVNPIAPIRSAAAIMERELRGGPWSTSIERAITDAVRSQLISPTLELRCRTPLLVEDLVNRAVTYSGVVER